MKMTFSPSSLSVNDSRPMMKNANVRVFNRPSSDPLNMLSHYLNGKMNGLGTAAVFPFSEGRSKCALYRPTVAESGAYRRGADAKPITPLSNGHCFAVERQKNVIGAVVLLFFHGRPATISRLVANRIFNAVNRVLLTRQFAHVGKEVLKTMPPAVADGNSLGSVVLIPAIGRQITPLNHGFPCFVNAVLATPMRRIALDEGSRNTFGIQTSAGLRFSHPQALTSGKCLPATLADTVPSRGCRPVVRSTTDNRQASKLLTSEINESRHIVNMTRLVTLSKVQYGY
jgi:hypothetical protein